jgi:Domain of unknown function (DUF4214)
MVLVKRSCKLQLCVLSGALLLCLCWSDAVFKVSGEQTSFPDRGRNELTAATSNPIDDASAFVRQHYLDFLNREPDSDGLAFWTDQITSCNTDLSCLEVKRINVSAAFFLSIEFQETGYLVERIYRAAYGAETGMSTFGGAHQLPVPIVRFNEFLADTQTISQGVLVGQSGWETVLENNKQAFTGTFVQRPRFTAAFPATMTPAQFVDTLNTNAGNPLSPSERNQLVADLTVGAKTRAKVLRAVSEDPDLHDEEFNRAFVLMQYFGYLRRNPNDAPDSDHTGYDFWLTKLNQFNGNFVDAEMVKAFIVSGEYRLRFAITLSANPDPISDRLCTGCGAGSTDREAVTDLTIQETNGVAGTVTSVALTLLANGSNAVIASGQFDGVAFFAGSNRLLANGSLVAHDIGVHFPQSFTGTPSTLTYTVRVTDDNGNHLSRALSVQVNPQTAPPLQAR